MKKKMHVMSFSVHFLTHLNESDRCIDHLVQMCQELDFGQQLNKKSMKYEI